VRKRSLGRTRPVFLCELSNRSIFHEACYLPFAPEGFTPKPHIIFIHVYKTNNLHIQIHNINSLLHAFAVDHRLQEATQILKHEEI
jgi:hypothetical protein